MNLDRMLELTGTAETPQCWREHWEEAQRGFPGNAFMNPELADVAAASTDLDPEFLDLLRRAISAIRADGALLRLAWLWRFAYIEKNAGGANSWPRPSSLGDELSGMFPAAVLVTCLLDMLDMHKRMGIPEKVTRDTLSGIAIWAEDYRTKHGRWGFVQLDWLRHHIVGELFRLVRLEFMQMSYPGYYRVYRNKADGAVLAVQESSELPTGEWDLLLEHGTHVLDIHIPAGAKLDHQACIDSYRMANEFYPRFFPEHKHKGFVCCSWLLDPELAKILPPDSNIVLFQSDFHLIHPVPDDGQTFERVFGGKPDDLTKAPRDTALRRAILDHVLAGNRMGKGYGFMPRDGQPPGE